MDPRNTDEALAHLAAIVEFSDDAIISKTLQGIITSWNRGAEKLYGYTASETVGQPISMLIPEGYLNEEPRILERIKRGELIDHYETLRMRKDGSTLDVSVTISPVRDATGKIIGASKIARDITGRKKAEAEIKKLNDELEGRIAERTEQLESANKDLEAFSYSVSHDLRAPLRHIQGFVEILGESPAMKEEEQLYIEKIVRAVKRMNDLINALLTFSRTGVVQVQQEMVSMEKLAAEAMQEAKMEEGRNRIRWKIGALPAVCGDDTLLKQVWCNVLSNAAKFSRDESDPEIAVSGVERETECEFAVRDNGVGFDAGSAGKLFGMFERLDTAKGIEGTGIGLANVRRIVERHGGRIWAESEAGQGATFRFTIPKRPEAVPAGKP